MSTKLIFASTVLAVALSGTGAQTTLYIPGADPQPITADILGVGADGETTWLLGPGVSSGTLEDIGIPGPATLIEGPSAAKFIFNFPAESLSLEEDCEINEGLATCVVVVATDGTPVTVTQTETVAPFTVQGGGAAPTAASQSSESAPAAASSAGTGVSQTSGLIPSAGSSAGTGVSQTAGNSASTASSSSGTSAPTQTGNGVGKMQSGVVAAIFATGMALIALL